MKNEKGETATALTSRELRAGYLRSKQATVMSQVIQNVHKCGTPASTDFWKRMANDQAFVHFVVQGIGSRN